MLCVRDIMTREVMSLTPDATIRDAMEALSTNHLSGAPVISGNKVVGVISMTDILGFIISSPEAGQATQSEPADEDWEDPESEIEDSEVRSAALSEDTWEEWTHGSEARVDDASPEGDNLLDQRTVEEAMNTEIFSVPPTASVRAAATVMRKKGIHRVLVMEEKTLLGIVSSLDIARVVSEKGLAGMSGIRTQPRCDESSPWITS